MNSNCWYCLEDITECAKGQNIEWCDSNCPIYKNVKSHFGKSNLPEKYWWPFTLKKTKTDAEAIDKILDIKKGEILKKVPEDELLNALEEELKNWN